LETAQRIYESLNEDGLYLTNIIAAAEGEKSKFIKAEIKTFFDR